MKRQARMPSKVISSKLTPEQAKYATDSIRLTQWMLHTHNTNLNIFLHMVTRIGWDTIVGKEEMRKLYEVEQTVSNPRDEYYINYDFLIRRHKNDPVKLIQMVYFACPDMFLRYQLYALLYPVADLVTAGDMIRGMVKFFTAGASINPMTHVVYAERYSTQTLHGYYTH